MLLLALTVGEGNDLAECSGYDASAALTFVRSHHGVGFAATGLAVCKNSAIIPLDDTVDKGEGSFFVDIALKAVSSEHLIESEGFGIFLDPGFI